MEDIIIIPTDYSRNQFTWTIRRQTQRLRGKVQMMRIKEKTRMTLEHRASVADGGSLLIVLLLSLLPSTSAIAFTLQ